MKKLTSLFLAGMVATIGCASAISSVSADTGAKVTLSADELTPMTSVTVNKGDKIEFTVTGFSDKAITGAVVATYINQSADSDSPAEYTDTEVLRYADGYYTDDTTSAFYKSAFAGYQVRPESEEEFDRDKFGYCYVLGRPSGDYNSETGQFMYSFAVDVVGDGNCWVKTVLEDVTFENEAGEPETDLSALKLKTTMKVEYAGEVPTDAPTDAPTEEIPTDVPTDAPTDAPSEVVTEIVTDAPTSATNVQPTVAPTEKATTITTSAPTSANNNSGNNNSSNTTSNSGGKVATGSNRSVMVTLLCASAALLCAFAVRKRQSK